MCAAVSLEEVESLDTNNNNLDIANGGSIKTNNKQRSFKGLDSPMLHYFDEGSKLDEERNATIFNEYYEVLEKNRMKEAHQRHKIWNA